MPKGGGVVMAALAVKGCWCVSKLLLAKGPLENVAAPGKPGPDGVAIDDATTFDEVPKDMDCAAPCCEEPNGLADTVAAGD